MPQPITLHLRAADGATFDLTIPGPNLPATVRIASIAGYSVQETSRWDGATWQPAVMTAAT